MLPRLRDNVCHRNNQKPRRKDIICYRTWVQWSHPLGSAASTLKPRMSLAQYHAESDRNGCANLVDIHAKSRGVALDQAEIGQVFHVLPHPLVIAVQRPGQVGHG